MLSDLPHYYATWSALIISLLTLLLPEPLVEPSAVILSDSFGVDQQTKTFMTRQVYHLSLVKLGLMIDISRYYIPHIKRAFLPRNLPLANKIQLFLGTMQTVKKLVYAFIFQEGR